MKKCALILPYFGNLNNYFQLFLNSFSSNKSFDMFIFTDNTQEYDYPENVFVIPFSLPEIKSRLDKICGFSVCLKDPYKLCDYKPTYGLVFAEYVKNYDYWGHCDCDLLFGDLDKLLFPLLKDNKYDKLFAAGHLTLYRNTAKVNKMFMEEYDSRQIFKEAFSTDKIYVFDEDYQDNNVHRLFLQHGMHVYEHDLSMNPTSRRAHFIRSYYDPQNKGFRWEKNNIGRYYWKGNSIIGVEYDKKKKIITRKEYLYFHLQSRIMTVPSNIFDGEMIEILPDRFVLRKSVPSSKKELNILGTYFPNLYWLRVYKKRLKKNGRKFRVIFYGKEIKRE